MKSNRVALLSLAAVMLLSSGCAANGQPKKQTIETVPQQTVKHEYVYETDKKIKEAIVILIKKIEAMEDSGSISSESETLALKREIDALKKEGCANEALEKRIRALEEKINAVQAKRSKSGMCTKTFIYTVHENMPYMATQNVNVRPCPTYESIPSGQIKKGEVVYFEGCNEFGWCKIKGGSGYVAGHFFKKISKKTDAKKSGRDQYDRAIMDYLKER